MRWRGIQSYGSILHAHGRHRRNGHMRSCDGLCGLYEHMRRDGDGQWDDLSERLLGLDKRNYHQHWCLHRDPCRNSHSYRDERSRCDEIWLGECDDYGPRTHGIECRHLLFAIDHQHRRHLSLHGRRLGCEFPVSIRDMDVDRRID
jgi:hypothetical protein